MRVTCDCAPGFFGDGSYCTNKSCDALAPSAQTVGSFTCPPPGVNDTHPAGAECVLECPQGRTSSRGVVAVCLGGEWGLAPTSVGTLPDCDVCAPGYFADTSGACHAGSNDASSTGSIVGLVAGLALVAVVAAAVTYRYYQRLRRRKMYHFFISYRVKTDAAVAEDLFHLLDHKSSVHTVRSGRATAVSCFWDQASLTAGDAWQAQFLRALHHSCVYVPLISAEVE